MPTWGVNMKKASSIYATVSAAMETKTTYFTACKYRGLLNPKKKYNRQKYGNPKYT